MTYREDWDMAPPEIKSFYSNFALRYSDKCAKFWDPYWGFKDYFSAGAIGYVSARAPYGLFFINMALQDYWWGFHDAALVYWAIEATYSGNEPSLPADMFYGWPVEDQNIFVPEYCTNYPAPRVRARRSYWTGTSRRRRNL